MSVLDVGCGSGGTQPHSLSQSVDRGHVVFSNCLADLTVLAAIPSMFVALVVSFPIVFRGIERIVGLPLQELLDRQDRSRVPMTVRQSISWFPRVAEIVGYEVR